MSRHRGPAPGRTAAQSLAPGELTALTVALRSAEADLAAADTRLREAEDDCKRAQETHQRVSRAVSLVTNNE